MVEILGTGTPAVETEGEGAIGALIGGVIGFLRKVVEYALEYVGKVVQWAGQDPKAFSIFFMNALIMFAV